MPDASPHDRRVLGPADARRSSAVTVIFLALLTAVIAGCTSNTDRHPPGAAPAVTGIVTPGCNGAPTREPCDEIVVGERVIRYALLPAKQATADSVLVDLGGPGLSVLSGTHRLAALKERSGRLGSAYNWIVVEEPWVTATLDDRCAAALSAYYGTLSTARGSAAATAWQVRGKCGLESPTGRWGFDPRGYDEIVHGIAGKHRLTINGFVGHSFGAARLGYLSGTELRWAILSKPFPVGASADEIVAARAVAVKSATDVGKEPATDSGISAFDLASAQVGLGHLTGDVYQEQRTAVLERHDRTAARRLSDNLWFRYGENSIAPALLAQFEEICPLTGPVTGDRYAADVEGVLRAAFLPCAANRPSPPPPAAVGKVCVITSNADTVAPARLSRKYLALRYPTASFVDLDRSPHTSDDGLAQCHTRVDP